MRSRRWHAYTVTHCSLAVLLSPSCARGASAPYLAVVCALQSVLGAQTWELDVAGVGVTIAGATRTGVQRCLVWACPASLCTTRTVPLESAGVRTVSIGINQPAARLRAAGDALASCSGCTAVVDHTGLKGNSACWPVLLYDAGAGNASADRWRQPGGRICVLSRKYRTAQAAGSQLGA